MIETHKLNTSPQHTVLVCTNSCVTQTEDQSVETETVAGDLK